MFDFCESFRLLNPLSTDYIDFPQQFQNLRIRTISNEMYRLVLRHIQHLWRYDEHVHSDLAIRGDGVKFIGDVDLFSFLLVLKIRYGAASRHRGLSARFAYIDGRIPVQIKYLFRLSQMRSRPDRPLLTTTIAIVRRFQHPHQMPQFPWDAR